MAESKTDSKDTEVKAEVEEKDAPKKAPTQKTTAQKGKESEDALKEFNEQNGEASEESRSQELAGESVAPENDSLSTITNATDRTNDGYAPQPVAPPVGTTREELAEGEEWVLPSHLREPVKVKSKRY
jgi:hypothetical protein